MKRKIIKNTIFALLAAMILLAIAGIPKYLKIRRKKLAKNCLSNRKLLNDSANKFMMDHSKDLTSQGELIQEGYIADSLRCPVIKKPYWVKACYETGMINLCCYYEKHGSYL